MRYSTVTCHCCGKIMVPRTTYSRGLWTYTPTSNHCPFCLSENWHGNNPTIGMRMFWLIGLGLGVLACIMVGALLFKLQWLAGIEGVYPWLSLLTCAIAAYAGYRFYAWFVAWEG